MDKNKIMMIIIIALLVVLLGSIVGVFFLVRGYVNDNPNPEQEIANEIADVNYTQLQIVSIPTISTNLATSSDGVPRTAKVELAYSIITDQEESAALATLLADKEAVVRSTALGVIRGKTYEEIMRSDSQQMLEEEILVKLQEVFETNLIYSVIVYDMIAV